MTEIHQDRFQIRGTGAEATGYPSANGFTVCRGAVARKDVVPSAPPKLPDARRKLLIEGVLKEFDGHYSFMKDYEFKSPSGAAAMVLGRTSNGWNEWLHPDGRTLSEVLRVSRAPGTTMLNGTKLEQIRAKYEEMLREGKLYTEAQLKKFYQNFVNRFGPKVLSGMDGEELLEYMHGNGGDSLSYWLEFKNDDEFPTRDFGSIAGGAALKFRVFRRSETGHWQGANKKGKAEDIEVAQAIEIARAHRDQLIRGVELLEDLPTDATDEVYAKLQDDLDEAAPDVSRLAWGHKYFSLLFPDKLDDYHSPDWQRFHILKMLQLPAEGTGRYINAGRFVSAAREAEIPMNQFTGVLNVVHGRLHRYWRIGTRGGDNVSHWSMMRERSVIAVGWTKMRDLSWVEANQEKRAKLKQLLQQAYPNNVATAIGRDAQELIHFIAGIAEGDVVLASDGAKVLGIGVVSGAYEYCPDFSFPHQRSVTWLDTHEWKMPIAEGLRSAVRPLNKKDENILEAESRIQGTSSITDLIVDPAPEPRPQLSKFLTRIHSVLDRKSQVVLYGPPGTGKTYWAEKAAYDFAALNWFNKLFEDLSDEQRTTIVGEGDLQGCVRMCCFHPAYGYEDFLEGYRPQTIDGHISFELRDGIFKQICEDAERNPDRKFYLIVDEINRGDIPRIFGELLTTLETDKRGKRIVLPVSRRILVVPKNVFIIGTMNTADRSISLLDAALRRRFGFVELMPDGKVLKDAKVSGIPLRAWFESLNSRIRQHVGRDARNLQIGHSYLMQAGSPIKDIAVLKRVIRDDIIPLLEEYCYEDYPTLGSILGTVLVNVTEQRIVQDLFDDGKEDDLVQALLSPCPEIMTSTEAIATEESSLDNEVDTEDVDDDPEQEDQ